MEATASQIAARREIDLHRRVCVITHDTIDIRPARSAAIAPLIGVALGIACFVAVLFLIQTVPFVVTLLLMGVAILLVPFSGMGFVYSVYGANVVFNRTKRTALWQQGLLGMGVGTEELVPFEKMERFEVVDMSAEEQADGRQDFVQYEVVLAKKSGKRLSLGQVTVPREAAADGHARALAVAEAVSELSGVPYFPPPAGDQTGAVREQASRARRA
jgi:hypothetical protein